jgi:hypothetical protein
MKYNDTELRAVLTDGRYQDIGNLPSNFYPYPGETKMYIRPFTIKELKLVSKAALLKDMSHLIRAVDLVTTMDAGNLTVGDFFYVLMWLRIHSMPKTPYVVEWHCKEPILVHKTDGSRIYNDHTFQVPKDEANWKVDHCTAHNSEIVHMTNVEIVMLDEDNYSGIPQNGIVEYDFPRARNIQEVQEALNDPELKLIVPAAQWIKEGDTLAEKIAVLERENDIQALDDAAVINETILHGISESTTLTCRDCRKRTDHSLVLDAYSFFR